MSGVITPPALEKLSARWAKLRSLGHEQRRVLAIAPFALSWTWLALRLLGTNRVLSRRQTIKREATSHQSSLESFLAVSDAVNWAARLAPTPTTCLTRSLVLQQLLRSEATELKIGVKLTGGKLEAHAWVEYQGTPINDRADIGTEFAAFDQALNHVTFQSR